MIRASRSEDTASGVQPCESALHRPAVPMRRDWPAHAPARPSRHRSLAARMRGHCCRRAAISRRSAVQRGLVGAETTIIEPELTPFLHVRQSSIRPYTGCWSCSLRRTGSERAERITPTVRGTAITSRTTESSASGAATSVAAKRLDQSAWRIRERPRRRSSGRPSARSWHGASMPKRKGYDETPRPSRRERSAARTRASRHH